jgi:hypothetical protein
MDTFGLMGRTLALGVLLLALVAPAEAQLATQGSFAGTLGWHAMHQASTPEPTRSGSVETFGGTFFNDADTGFLHHTSMVCQRIYTDAKATTPVHGSCLVTDQEGDTARLEWQCQGHSTCEGLAHWIDGSGKYAGITGTVAFSHFALTPTAAGYSLWKGSWQLQADKPAQARQSPGHVPAVPTVARHSQ